MAPMAKRAGKPKLLTVKRSLTMPASLDAFYGALADGKQDKSEVFRTALFFYKRYIENGGVDGASGNPLYNKETHPRG
jgi:hypothetical protein